jgi:two-component system, cell cycle sensor histidine kinase and response regulator CckA
VSNHQLLTADAATTEWLRRCDRIRIWGLAAFLVVAVLAVIGGAPVAPDVFLSFGVWLVAAGVAEWLLRRERVQVRGDRWRIAMLAADVLWITVLYHEAGGTRWLGVTGYLFVVVVAAAALSRRAAVALTVWSALAYGALLFAESTSLVSVHPWTDMVPLPATQTAWVSAWAMGSATLVMFMLLVRTLVALLARSEARHRLMFEASPRPMWVYDAETLRFLAVNNSAIHDYGYSREEFLAMQLTDIRPEEDRDAVRTVVATKTDAYLHAGIWRHRRRDGSVMDVEISSHPVQVDGRAARLVIVTDVTDRTRLETRLRETQRLEALGRLAGGVAHEFNNLLAAVLGHAELLLPEMPTGTTRRESVEEVVRAARRGADLTRHMLAFGRRQLLRPEVVDVSGVVRDMERLLRPLLTNDVRVALVLPPEPCWARVDRSQLELVIMNLAMNARDAMSDGGALTMETTVVELGIADRRRHPMAAVIAGPYVRLSVSDTGTGISPETVERMFEPFFTTKPVGRGTGLGLSTVYGIVKQSEGYVWPYSEIGRGTTMHVYLPCAPAPVSAGGEDGPAKRDAATAAQPAAVQPAAVQPVSSRGARRPAEAARPGGGSATATGRHRTPLTVLVADDEPALRAAAARVLRGAGYQVLEAGHGAEALAVADAAGARIDVLVTDVVMPGLGGVELAERVAERDPGVRIVYMSGYPQSHLAAAGGLAGGHAFVDKPFGVDTLLAAVQVALEVAV